MTRHDPAPSPAFPRKLRPAIRLAVAVSALSLAAFWGAHAQQAGSLRGALTADERDAAAAQTVPEEQQSRSEPAAAQQNGDAGLFDDPIGDGSDDIFGDPPAPPTRAPSTKRLRKEASEAQPAQTAAAPRNKAGAAAPTETDAEPDASTARAGREGNGSDEAEGTGRAEHALAIDALPRGDAIETNPYEAMGIRAGGFILRPSVETGITVSSNAARTAGGSPGVLAQTTLRLNARSDWSEHTATLDGFGTFRRSLSGDDEVRDVEGGVNAALLLDLGNDWQARTGLSYTVTPESASAIDAVAGADEQPLRQQFEAEAGLDKDVGKLRLGTTVSVERDWYGEAELADGGTVDQSGRDSTLGLLKLRAGYAVSPAITPFVEAEAGRRVYDDADLAARRVGARAGVALDLRDKLMGEISAGWLRESFEDSEIEPVQGPSLLASLRWSPERGTVVAFSAATSVEGAATPGDTGSLVQDLRLAVERTLRANLTAEAGLGASLRDYTGTDGQDLTLVADVGATWWLNRWFGLSGRLRHERLDSNLPDRDYRENSVFVGTKLQY